MNPLCSSSPQSPLRPLLWPVLIPCLVLGVSCSAPVQRPVGAAADYEDAKDMFKRGRFDRALEFSDGQAKSSPPTPYTDRSRVLRAIIFSGRIKAYKKLAEAYTEGVDNTKNPHFKAVYGQQRHDSLQYGATSALGLGEVAHQFTQVGVFPKELSLEVPWPTTEGPVEVRDLARVSEGGWVEPERQEAAALDAVRQGIDDTLAEAVQGDRAKARSNLTAGAVKLDGVDFALFMGRQLLEGASFYDRKHNRDPQKLRILCDQAEEIAKSATALLKQNPDKDKERQVKDFWGKIKVSEKY